MEHMVFQKAQSAAPLSHRSLKWIPSAAMARDAFTSKEHLLSSQSFSTIHLPIAF